MSDLPIYNCHIHIFTAKHVPRHFLKLFIPYLGVPLSELLRYKLPAKLFVSLMARFDFLSKNDVLKRQARFIKRSLTDTQEEILKHIRKQYPADTTFIVLPMDMEFLGLGTLDKSVDAQYEELLAIARGGRRTCDTILRCRSTPNRYR